MRRRWTAVAVAVVMVAAACSGDDSGGGPGGAAEATATEAGSWTVLVYQIADNDLEPFALDDLEEMAAVGSNENLNLIVMSDRSDGYTADPVLNAGDWDTAKTFEVAQGELIELADAGEVDMADPATLAEFVATGFEEYPADNHAVVFWDHGAGWPGMGPDESSGGLLTLPGMEQGLAEGMDAAGVEKLDLVGFDACLMATYEVGRAMAPLADFMLASQERTQNLSFGRNPDPAQDSALTDLGLLAEGLAEADPEIAAAAAAAAETLSAAVVGSVAGPATSEATGLSVYFPPYPELFADGYTEVEDDAWTPLLSAYYAAGEDIAEDDVVQFVEDPTAGPNATGEYLFDVDGLTISGTFAEGTADNLAEAVIYYGFPQGDGSVVYVGEEPGTLYDDGTADATFDLTTLTISDGVDTVDAYLDLGIDVEAGTATIDVPLAYYAPGAGADYQDLLLSLVLDAEFNILSETYYAFQEGGTLGEFTADPEGLIVPLVQYQGPDGTLEWVPNSDVGLYADIPALAYDFAPLPSGTPLRVELTVFDFGGNSDFVFAEDLVP